MVEPAKHDPRDDLPPQTVRDVRDAIERWAERMQHPQFIEILGVAAARQRAEVLGEVVGWLDRSAARQAKAIGHG